MSQPTEAARAAGEAWIKSTEWVQENVTKYGDDLTRAEREMVKGRRVVTALLDALRGLPTRDAYDAVCAANERKRLRILELESPHAAAEPEPWEVKCPLCGAAEGMSCVSITGSTVADHSERRQNASGLASSLTHDGTPGPWAEVLTRCSERLAWFDQQPKAVREVSAAMELTLSIIGEIASAQLNAEARPALTVERLTAWLEEAMEGAIDKDGHVTAESTAAWLLPRLAGPAQEGS